jgi:hypothetical protein
MSLNPKQVKLLLNFFPISSNPCIMGITEQNLSVVEYFCLKSWVTEQTLREKKYMGTWYINESG